MKIIKEGNLDKAKQTIRFKCNVCRCAFEADVGEYQIIMYKPLFKKVAYVKCPTCKNIVYERKKG